MHDLNAVMAPRNKKKQRNKETAVGNSAGWVIFLGFARHLFTVF